MNGLGAHALNVGRTGAVTSSTLELGNGARVHYVGRDPGRGEWYLLVAVPGRSTTGGTATSRLYRSATLYLFRLGIVESDPTGWRLEAELILSIPKRADEFDPAAMP